MSSPLTCASQTAAITIMAPTAARVSRPKRPIRPCARRAWSAAGFFGLTEGVRRWPGSSLLSRGLPSGALRSTSRADARSAQLLGKALAAHIHEASIETGNRSDHGQRAHNARHPEFRAAFSGKGCSSSPESFGFRPNEMRWSEAEGLCCISRHVERAGAVGQSRVKGDGPTSGATRDLSDHLVAPQQLQHDFSLELARDRPPHFGASLHLKIGTSPVRILVSTIRITRYGSIGPREQLKLLEYYDNDIPFFFLKVK